MVKVKLFDEDHEQDLEESVNAFLATLKENQLIDIKYQVALGTDEEGQVFCFSAMVIYRGGEA